jgi:hypothetical protein
VLQQRSALLAEAASLVKAKQQVMELAAQQGQASKAALQRLAPRMDAAYTAASNCVQVRDQIQVSWSVGLQPQPAWQDSVRMLCYHTNVHCAQHTRWSWQPVSVPYPMCVASRLAWSIEGWLLLVLLHADASLLLLLLLLLLMVSALRRCCRSRCLRPRPASCCSWWTRSTRPWRGGRAQQQAASTLYWASAFRRPLHRPQRQGHLRRCLQLAALSGSGPQHHPGS